MPDEFEERRAQLRQRIKEFFTRTQEELDNEVVALSHIEAFMDAVEAREQALREADAYAEENQDGVGKYFIPAMKGRGVDELKKTLEQAAFALLWGLLDDDDRVAADEPCLHSWKWYPNQKQGRYCTKCGASQSYYTAVNSIWGK